MQWPPPNEFQTRYDLPAPARAATPSTTAAGAGKRKRGWLLPVVALGLVAALAVVLLTRGGNDNDTANPDDTAEATAVQSTQQPVVVTEPPDTPQPTVEMIIETTLPPDTTAAPETTIPPETTVDQQTTTVAPTSGGLAPDLNFVVATPEGTQLVNSAGSGVTLPGASAVAYSGFEGSLIVQNVSGRYDGPNEATNIRRVSSAGDAVIVAANGGEYLRLHDVSRGDGNDILVLYSKQEGSTPEDTEEGLYLLDLLSGRTTYIGVIGGWESGTNRLDLSSDLIVGEASESVTTAVFARDLGGNDVDLTAGLGLDGSYSDCSECPHHFAIDESGRFVAWGENGTLVIFDRTGAVDTQRIPVPGFVEGFGIDLEVREGLVIINREAAATLIVDTRSGAPVVSELPVLGVASFG